MTFGALRSCRICCTNIWIKHLEPQLVVILLRLRILHSLQVETVSLVKVKGPVESVSFAEHLQGSLYSLVVLSMPLSFNGQHLQICTLSFMF